MKTKRILSLVLAIALVLGMGSVSVLAKDNPQTADVYVAAQAYGGFLVAPQTMTVPEDISDSYGFVDSVDGVSVLDVLIKTHELIFGDDFSAETADEFLSAGGGYISKIFGVETYNCGFLLNGGTPNDGTASAYGGYNGTTVSTQEAQSGDKVDFFIYQDSWGADNYTWIDGTLSALPGSDAEVIITGASPGWTGYLFATPDDFKDSADVLEGVSLAWVDENGALDEIDGVYTDEDGKAVIHIPSDMAAGEYYLTAAGEDDTETPVLMNPVLFSVTDEVTAYVSISDKGDIVKTKDGNLFSRLPVTLSDKTGYSIDDVLSKAHNEYANALHGYASAVGYYGLGITKLWGDESGAFGYMQNDDYAWSLSDPVSDGDFIHAFIYKDSTGWSDVYTKFENADVSTSAGAETVFTLLRYDSASGYIPCEGITLTVDELPGLETVTDVKGQAKLVFPAEGIYTVIAKNTDVPIVPATCSVTVSAPIAVTGISLAETLNVYVNDSAKVAYEIVPSDAYDKTVSWKSSDESVATVSNGIVTGIAAGSADITATTKDGKFEDVCRVTVKEVPSAVQIMHNIAAKYAEGGIASDINAPWLAADLASYRAAFPDTENFLSDKQIQEYLDVLIPAADTTSSPGDLAKYIIALRALGFDPENVYTPDLRRINIVEKLKLLIDQNNPSVTNIYTLPYVIIAMGEDEGYLGPDGINALISSALEQKDDWQNSPWGTDAASAMLLALAPYYDTNGDVKTAVDVAIEIIKNAQTANGLIANASSSGLALAALSGYKIYGENVKNGAASLVDGLATQAANSLDGFLPDTNTFATEQGFRGLVAWQLLSENKGHLVYDFSKNSKNSAFASWGKHCPVSFNVIPYDSSVTVEGQTPVAANKYDLTSGEYNYSVSKDGYVTESGHFTVSGSEDTSHTPKTINASLASRPSSDGKISVNISVLTHNENECGGNYTYKKNASKYTPVASATLSLSKGQTVFDALNLLLKEKNIEYTEKTYGYISSINGVSEFDHGKNSGWLYTVNGKSTDKGCRDVSLSKNSTVVWFYTDDYTEEAGSENWKRSSSAQVKTSAAESETQTAPTQKTENIFIDVDKNAWYYNAVGYVYEHKIMLGTDKGFEPNKKMTRAMLVTVLYRLEAAEEKKSECKFTDVKDGEWYFDAVAWGYENGIINGMSDTVFAPNESVTREQTALILLRYAKMKGYFKEDYADLSKFDDAGLISDWSLDSIRWANAAGLIEGVGENLISPQSDTTRAEAAMLLMRFFEVLAK